MFLHIFYSWLLAQVIHPFLMTGFWWLLLGSIDVSDIGSELLFVFFISAIFSFPLLLVGWLVLDCIVDSEGSVMAKFLTWLFATVILVILSFWPIILGGGAGSILLLSSVPAVLSIWISSALRFGQFQKLICKRRNSNHETSLV